MPSRTLASSTSGRRAGFDRTKFTPTRTIDARGKAILPGLVNTHIHLVGAYIKGLTEDVPGKGDTAGLYKRGFPVVCALQPDDFYSGCMTHALEMVMTGTTTFSSTWMHEALAGPVVRDLGARGVLSEWIVGTDLLKLDARNMDRPWDPAMVERSLEAAVESLRDLARQGRRAHHDAHLACRSGLSLGRRHREMPGSRGQAGGRASTST